MEKQFSEVLEWLANELAARIGAQIAPGESKEYGNYEFYTLKQLSEKLHVSKSTLYRHRLAGYLVPAKYLGRTPLFDNQSINDYLNRFDC